MKKKMYVNACTRKNNPVESRENLYSSLKHAGHIWRVIKSIELSVRARGPSICPNHYEQRQLDEMYTQYTRYWNEIIPTKVSTIANWNDECEWFNESGKCFLDFVYYIFVNMSFFIKGFN